MMKQKKGAVMSLNHVPMWTRAVITLAEKSSLIRSVLSPSWIQFWQQTKYQADKKLNKAKQKRKRKGKRMRLEAKR